ncbi:MAG: transglutaminase domain-containing protein, partial [Leptolyngbya sp.]|nr:transglutaminase domain-containing protein [Leptolyngbya sp.]
MRQITASVLHWVERIGQQLLSGKQESSAAVRAQAGRRGSIRNCLLASWLAVPLASAAEARAQAEPWIAPPAQQYQYISGNRFFYRNIPADAQDPVVALTESEQSALLSRKIKAIEILPAYLNRIEAWLLDSQALGADLAAWLREKPLLRRSLLLALDPFLDRPAGALQVLERLRNERPELCDRFPQLAVAAAVVHDSPLALASARYFLVWGVSEAQWPALPDYLDILDVLTDPTNRTLVLRPDKLVWPLLVHVVDCDLPAEERVYAVKQFAPIRENLQSLYDKVRYDYNKLDHEPSLGDLPYTIANLLNPQYGGVCVDQAHLTARVMKLFGIPAVKARGDSRHGGAGHAWTCYLTFQKGWGWADTGRYAIDNYWTGTIFDPQRETLFSDRALLMDLDGAVRGFSAFEEARAFARMASALLRDQPEASWLLAQEALARNPFCSEGWRLFLAHLAQDRVSDSSVQAHLRVLLTALADHPDVTLAVLRGVLNRIDAKDLKRRMDLYRKAQNLYQKRPDLQLRLAEAQASELFAADQPAKAVEIAVAAFERNVEEGSLC